MVTGKQCKGRGFRVFVFMALFLAGSAWMGNLNARADILAHWKLDGDLTDVAHNYDGTLYDYATNGVAWTTGQFGQAIDLRSGSVGYRDHVNTGLNLSGDPKTMVFYARPQAFSGSRLWAGNSSSGDTRFYLGAYDTEVFLGGGGSGYHNSSYTWPVTSTTEFHHYALVDEQSPTKQVNAYQDGNLIHTLNYSGSSAGTNFTIGDVRGLDANAALDEVAVFDTVLGDGDIQYIADHGVEGYVMKNWRGDGWNYRQQVTVSSDVTGSNLSEFPVLVKITDPANPIFANARADGNDIRFTDAHGNTLAYEIESYSSGAHELAAWVKTNVSSDHDTKLYIYYGKSDAADAQDVEGTWNGDFQMVQHFDEDSGGTHSDSTSNNNDATVTGANMDAAGKINGADHFDGSGDWVDLPYGAGIDPTTSPHTFSMWVKSDNPSASDIFFSSGQDPNNRMYIGHEYSDWEMGINTDGWGEGQTETTDEWTYLTLVLDGSTASLYVNGAHDHDKSYSSPFILAQNINVGRHPTSPGTYDYTGTFDEVRISTIARDADWILASYRTQLYGTDEQYVSFGPHLPLPEPGSMVLLALGTALLLVLRLRRRAG